MPRNSATWLGFLTLRLATIARTMGNLNTTVAPRQRPIMYRSRRLLSAHSTSRACLSLFFLDIIDLLDLQTIAAIARTNKTLGKEAGRSLYQKDAKGDDPRALYWAAQHGQLPTLKKAVSADMDVNAPQLDSENTALALAATEGHTAIIEHLLKNGKAYPDPVDVYARTPLSLAAESGHVNVVELLLDTGKVIPDLTDVDDRTPLSWAAQSGHVDIVELLLSTGMVNPDSRDAGGRTPLSWADESRHMDIVELLRDNMMR